MERLRVAYISASYSPIVEALHKQANLTLIVGTTPRPEKSRHPLALLRRFLAYCRGFRSLADWADKQNLPYRQFSRDHQRELADEIQDQRIDVLVSYAAPILADDLLHAPAKEALNIHPSRLPDYRGGNPILWQIIAGEQASAVTIHRLTNQLDQGDILAQVPYAISPGDSRDSIVRTVHQTASTAIVGLLQDIGAGRTPEPRAQPSHSDTPVAYNRTREQLESLIPWQQASSDLLFRVVGYLDHWPFEIAVPSGWRSLLPYRASRPLSPSDDRPAGLSANLLALVYQSSGGAVELRPRLTPIAVLRHLLMLRRLRRGSLKYQYL
ncbi:MAG: formyltransferase family protein [Marinobacter sp.]|uniref:formyltransferase family protein n=1 Tax=Marinobacter sp. TaxID=50741 RepID=UPI00299DD5F0|nr:formyltransferase family protein [Marinobacter sp.]MDX1756595.1 formyltransferase family protein [Marinobacter sp.]